MEQEKEEKKVVDPKELAELTRLNMERERVMTQAKRMKYPPIVNDMVEKVKRDALDYIMALSKKYNFNPYKFGVNRNTGEIMEMPSKKEKKKKK